MESAAGPSMNAEIDEKGEYNFVTLMCQNDNYMPVAATIFTDKDCSSQSARIPANSIDPYDQEIYMHTNLYDLGMVRKYRKWAIIKVLKGFGVSSVMIPEGYAMTFSNHADFGGEGKDRVTLVGLPSSKNSGRC